MAVHQPRADSLIKVALEVLVCVVDEQLLQAVGVKLLEAVDVQHPNEPPHVAESTPRTATHIRAADEKTQNKDTRKRRCRKAEHTQGTNKNEHQQGTRSHI